MVSDTHAFTVVAVISVVTIALRVAPFFVLGKLSQSGYMRYIGEKMPTGVMVLLVAYTIKDLDVSVYPYGLPTLVSLCVAAVMYWKTDNSLLSIGGGVALYMTLVNVVV
ncbi:branched-chain amino acid transporter [Streptomyces sp. TRM43335]|uniref:Branched-chain amino acid transporter n=1 Tax=Streptomyces taklimakanensis TaxID=2569853 RepID=A0A6G2BBM9_9ACTN|nr:AzlD domain-containing protein [Streptomyces taklimakanensis]MTE19479.1 branched-chain amino acid transporter [Streptomyces taklimakanensis]